MDTENVCSCCALWIANNDESGCRDWFGHTHKRCDISYLWVLSSDGDIVYDEWTCFGCGEYMLPGAERWDIEKISIND